MSPDIRNNALTALVTGASRGIGKVIAQQLARRGVRVALHFHSNREAAQSTLQSLVGGGHALFAADLSVPGAAGQLWRQVVGEFGGVDVLINNAGLYVQHSPLRIGLDAWQSAWQRTLQTNLIASADLTLLAAQFMAARVAPEGTTFGRGRIVNISSRGAFRGEPDAPAYAASKAGLNATSQSLAKALAGESIYVYCIAPGWVETEMAAGHLSGPDGPAILAQHPLGRVNTCEEVAQATVYCALDAPAAMTGCVIDVNGASYLRT